MGLKGEADQAGRERRVSAELKDMEARVSALEGEGEAVGYAVIGPRDRVEGVFTMIDKSRHPILPMWPERSKDNGYSHRLIFLKPPHSQGEGEARAVLKELNHYALVIESALRNRPPRLDAEQQAHQREQYEAVTAALTRSNTLLASPPIEEERDGRAMEKVRRLGGPWQFYDGSDAHQPGLLLRYANPDGSVAEPDGVRIFADPTDAILKPPEKGK